MFLLLCVRFGFIEEELSRQATLAYEIRETESFFFRVLSHRDTTVGMTVNITDGEHRVALDTVNTSRFYRVYGQKVSFSRLKSERNVVVETLRVHRDMCNEYAMALSVSKYMSVTHTLTNESSKLCLLFFQPRSDYRLVFSCASPSRRTLCSIHTQDSMSWGTAPITCGANATCDISFMDGAVIQIEAEEGASVEHEARLFMIKGREDEINQCHVSQVDFYNGTGEFTGPEFDNEVKFECNEPSEPVLIAVVLTVCLVMGLASAWLIYYKCRPNRQAYESDEAVKREREMRRKRTKQRKGEYMSVRRGSDAGYTDKKNNLMMPLCE